MPTDNVSGFKKFLLGILTTVIIIGLVFLAVALSTKNRQNGNPSPAVVVSTVIVTAVPKQPEIPSEYASICPGGVVAYPLKITGSDAATKNMLTGYLLVPVGDCNLPVLECIQYTGNGALTCPSVERVN